MINPVSPVSPLHLPPSQIRPAPESVLIMKNSSRRVALHLQRTSYCNPSGVEGESISTAIWYDVRLSLRSVAVDLGVAPRTLPARPCAYRCTLNFRSGVVAPSYAGGWVTVLPPSTVRDDVLLVRRGDYSACDQ